MKNLLAVVFVLLVLWYAVRKKTKFLLISLLTLWISSAQALPFSEEDGIRYKREMEIKAEKKAHRKEYKQSQARFKRRDQVANGVLYTGLLGAWVWARDAWIRYGDPVKPARPAAHDLSDDDDSIHPTRTPGIVTQEDIDHPLNAADDADAPEVPRGDPPSFALNPCAAPGTALAVLNADGTRVDTAVTIEEEEEESSGDVVAREAAPVVVAPAVVAPVRVTVPTEAQEQVIENLQIENAALRRDLETVVTDLNAEQNARQELQVINEQIIIELQDEGDRRVNHAVADTNAAHHQEVAHLENEVEHMRAVVQVERAGQIAALDELNDRIFTLEVENAEQQRHHAEELENLERAVTPPERADLEISPEVVVDAPAGFAPLVIDETIDGRAEYQPFPDPTGVDAEEEAPLPEPKETNSDEALPDDAERPDLALRTSFRSGISMAEMLEALAQLNGHEDELPELHTSFRTAAELEAETPAPEQPAEAPAVPEMTYVHTEQVDEAPVDLTADEPGHHMEIVRDDVDIAPEPTEEINFHLIGELMESAEKLDGARHHIEDLNEDVKRQEATIERLKNAALDVVAPLVPFAPQMAIENHVVDIPPTEENFVTDELADHIEEMELLEDAVERILNARDAQRDAVHMVIETKEVADVEPNDEDILPNPAAIEEREQLLIDREELKDALDELQIQNTELQGQVDDLTVERDTATVSSSEALDVLRNLDKELADMLPDVDKSLAILSDKTVVEEPSTTGNEVDIVIMPNTEFTPYAPQPDPVEEYRVEEDRVAPIEAERLDRTPTEDEDGELNRPFRLGELAEVERILIAREALEDEPGTDDTGDDDGTSPDVEENWVRVDGQEDGAEADSDDENV
jgi:hypothetical protein